MKARPQQVVIVQQGAYSPAHYEAFIKEITGILESANRSEGKSVAVVERVLSWQEVRSKAKRGEVDIVVFVSGGMIDVARQLQKRFKSIDVWVLTSKPMGEPYFVPKELLNQEAIEQLLEVRRSQPEQTGWLLPIVVKHLPTLVRLLPVRTA